MLNPIVHDFLLVKQTLQVEQSETQVIVTGNRNVSFFNKLT